MLAMLSKLRRETIIALRARRQGHQMASEILSPHMEVPEFHSEPRPVEDLHRHPWDDEEPRPPEPPPEWHRPVDLPDWLKAPHVCTEKPRHETTDWSWVVIFFAGMIILLATVFLLDKFGR
jgi:hypothetical protein